MAAYRGRSTWSLAGRKLRKLHLTPVHICTYITLDGVRVGPGQGCGQPQEARGSLCRRCSLARRSSRADGTRSCRERRTALRLRWRRSFGPDLGDGVYTSGPRHPAHILAQSEPGGTSHLRGCEMRKEYDFSKAKRGAAVAVPKGKSRITIRLDDDVLEWFKEQVDLAGGGNYQTLINAALRDHIGRAAEPLEKTLRRVLREELRKAG